MAGGRQTPGDYGTHVGGCEKLCYPDRKTARKALKLVPGHHLRPYECREPGRLSDHWHVGHIPKSVMRGYRTVDQIYR